MGLTFLVAEKTYNFHVQLCFVIMSRQARHHILQNSCCTGEQFLCLCLIAHPNGVNFERKEFVSVGREGKIKTTKFFPVTENSVSDC